MMIKQAWQRLEKAVKEALATFFVMMGDGEAPEFWHENQDLKPIPLPVRRPAPRRDDYR